MRTRIKRICVALLALAIVVTGAVGSNNYAQAALTTSIKFVEEPNIVVKPGETTHVKLSVQSTGTYISEPVITITAEDGSPFTFSNIAINSNGVPVYGIVSSSPTNLEFDIKTKEAAGIGNYPITIKFKYYDSVAAALGGDPNVTLELSTEIQVLEEKMPVQLTLGNINLLNSNIGSKTDIIFNVKNEGEITAKNVYMTLDLGDSLEERYTAKSIKVGDLASGDVHVTTLPVLILPTAETGRKKITASFTYKTPDGDSVTSTYDFYVSLTSETSVTQLPKLVIADIQSKGSLKPSDDFVLNVDLQNIGGAEARNIKVNVDDSSISSEGILKNYFTEGISVNGMPAEFESVVEIPLTVSKYATGGLKGVKIVVTYEDKDGTSYTVSDTAYIDVIASTPTTGSPNIIISNVSQSPAKPVAGDKVEVSFDVLNKSDVDAKELKIYTEGLTSATFIPINAEPYRYIETLKAGKTIRITVPLMVSEDIVEGLNSISIRYSYSGGTDGTVTIPVRDVQNDNVSISKPKIIVSKYSTDMEELRAGNTFNFTFDLYNTNASITAKNITVTVAQAENVFSVTQGSNSFFIEKIDPGETITNTLELKVKSDASTKAYPLELTIEYEYEGAEPNPTTGEIGETRTEKLNLQAVENSRPVVNNINVYSWDGAIMVGNTATLAFEFYNMGRSPLNNVIIYVEGDFAKADGEMYYVGTVPEGNSSYVEFDVIPNMEGTANGVLKVTFEDSNGDTVETTKDFTAQVMSSVPVDGGIIDGGGEVFNPGVIPVAKSEILPIWLFIIIQVVLFAVFVPVTRKVIIQAYKSKLRKKEQEQY